MLVIGDLIFLKEENKLYKELNTQLSQEKQDLISPFNGDIICWRTEHGPMVNIPHLIIHHSPGGFEWGYGGSGPADLALNALSMYIGRELAEKDGLYQDFKRKFIATMPFEGGIIKRSEVFNWLAAKGITKECCK